MTKHEQSNQKILDELKGKSKEDSEQLMIDDDIARPAFASEDIEELKEELEDAKDKVMRTLAEMDNVRRRAVADVEKAHKYGIEKFVKELLPVIDSLEKALEIGVKSEPALHEGVELTAKMLIKTLEKFGVKVIDPMGEPFNAMRHEAISIQPNPEVESNTVLHVLQKGYDLNGRLIRPAMVIVSA